MSIISNIIRRSQEPSTWGGIAVLLAVFGMSNEQAKAVTDLLAAAAATASVFMPEGKN
ncbi:MAG: hypothetical protein HQL77_17910 [Magnetococcales bacterium]|nr:hypothetical protein [Magnetococcales bacterium]MBF0437221.1 hypothetical protein [Magnetococcales bacterium]